MNRIPRIRSAARWALAVSISLCVPLAGGLAHAQDGQRPPPETRKAQVMRPAIYKKILPVQELLSEGKAKDALAKLKELDLESFNEYEKAVAYQMFGYAYSSQENYKEAISYFEKAIANQQLNPNLELDLRFNVAQMYRALEQLDKSLQRFEEWLALAESPTGTQYYQISSTYYQAEKYDKALPLIEKALATKPNPEQSWMNLAVALYIDRKNYKKAVPYLEQLATRFPKASYWKQLAAVYSELSQNKKTLVALELAYAQNFLESNTDIRRLAEMYIFLEIPYKAAVLMEKEMSSGRLEKDEKNWELLATAWFQARELDKALDPLSKAASLAKDGMQYLRLAQLYADKDRWDDALSAIAKAEQKGSLKSPGEAHLLRGIALFNTGKSKAARKAFSTAQKFKETRKQSLQWQKHIELKEAADADAAA